MRNKRDIFLCALVGVIFLIVVILSIFYFLQKDKDISPDTGIVSEQPNISSLEEELLNKLTNKELVFGTTKINFKVFSKDTSITQVTVNDNSKKLNIIYNIPGIDFGLLYMTKYQNGDLYITTRTDCPIKIFFNQYAANDCGENWNQKIMVYNPENIQGRVLYSGRGLGQYLVSEDGKHIAVEFQEDNNEYGDIFILDQKGVVIKEYTYKDVGFDRYIEPSLWKGDILYVISSGPGDFGEKIAFINIKTDQIASYPSIPDLNGGGISPDFKKIAYTDYPTFYDVESRESWLSNNNNLVNLFVYDLNSKTQTKIATAPAWKFNFSWLDSKTIQYNEPTTGKSVTKILE